MNIKVTIFEDNSNLRRGLTTLINGSDGFECAGAFGNCDNLIKNIRDTHPDVVLMDIEMPCMNGLDALKLLKPQFPELKILMETFDEDDEKVFQCICNGAEGYILKNTPPEQILDAIREIYEGIITITPGIAGKAMELFRTRISLSSHGSYNLTNSEREILNYLAIGMSYRATADKCYVSIDTISSHVKNIYKKLQVNSKSAAVAKAIKGKIV
jgi:DNA-binding NarL/FixJ family response regulator